MDAMKRSVQMKPNIVPKTLISPENPLRDFPYWNAPDGKNLNAIACLEWLEAYIKIMQNDLPCDENKDTLWHIGMALKSQTDRIARRKQQWVLGTHNYHDSTTNIDGITDVG